MGRHFTRPGSAETRWTWKKLDSLYIIEVFPIFPTQLIGLISMPAIRVKENEPFEVAIRRFKRTVEKTGLLTELRAREFYEKPTAERKRKLAAAVKRHHKRIRSQTLPPKMY